jgi:hypothetical protein
MKIDFEKSDGLVPVIVQHTNTLQVLMLGYMNKEALEKTETEGKVTFFSRSKGRLWTKGETSGNYLMVEAPIVTMVLINGVDREFATICKGDLLSAIISVPITPTAIKETEI